MTYTAEQLREIDALVAEYVMGWTWKDNNNEAIPEGTWEPCGIPTDQWEPSTDIAASWKVVEKMRDSGCLVSICHMLDKERNWHVTINNEKDEVYGNENPSAPLAICLAALKAVGKEYKP